MSNQQFGLFRPVRTVRRTHAIRTMRPRTLAKLPVRASRGGEKSLDGLRNQVSMTGLRSQRSMKRGSTPTPCLHWVTALFKGGHSTQNPSTSEIPTLGQLSAGQLGA